MGAIEVDLITVFVPDNMNATVITESIYGAVDLSGGQERVIVHGLIFLCIAGVKIEYILTVHSDEMVSLEKRVLVVRIQLRGSFHPVHTSLMQFGFTGKLEQSNASRKLLWV